MEGRFNGGFLHYWIGGLIFGGAYIWRGLFSEFYGMFLLAIVELYSQTMLIRTLRSAIECVHLNWVSILSRLNVEKI